MLLWRHGKGSLFIGRLARAPVDRHDVEIIGPRRLRRIHRHIRSRAARLAPSRRRHARILRKAVLEQVGILRADLRFRHTVRHAVVGQGDFGRGGARRRNRRTAGGIRACRPGCVAHILNIRSAGDAIKPDLAALKSHGHLSRKVQYVGISAAAVA